jgi:hypothetical protein
MSGPVNSSGSLDELDVLTGGGEGLEVASLRDKSCADMGKPNARGVAPLHRRYVGPKHIFLDVS